MSEEENKDPSQLLDEVVGNLQEAGIGPDQQEITVGLGDVISNTLNKFGVTPDTIQHWFGIKECGCKQRQKFLNGILSFLKK